MKTRSLDFYLNHFLINNFMNRKPFQTPSSGNHLAFLDLFVGFLNLVERGNCLSYFMGFWVIFMAQRAVYLANYCDVCTCLVLLCNTKIINVLCQGYLERRMPVIICYALKKDRCCASILLLFPSHCLLTIKSDVLTLPLISLRKRQ